MKRIPIIAGFVLCFISFLTVQCQAKDTAYFFDEADTTRLRATPEMEKESQVITEVLSRAHYRKTDLNDSLSSVILDNYMSSMDPSRVYFLKDDIEKIEQYREKLDDYLKEGDLRAAYEIYSTFRARFNERKEAIDSLVMLEFDFSKDEYYETNRDDASWAETQQELDEEWRKIIKSQALSLKLTDKDWPEIQDNLKKRYDRLHQYINQFNSMDVFQQYMNAFTEAYDPHTSYFSPRTAENFKITMSQSLEGIGASLQQEGDFTKVAEVIAGGPAFKSKELQKGDRIIGVAQGADGEMVDVIGWRLDEVVQLIRGKKGTKVRLSILRAAEGVNALPTEIIILRDKVKLEEQRAKKKMVPYTHNGIDYKIGVITIPSFYMDFEEAQKGNPDYASTTRDVRKLVNELKQEGMDGLLIDLTYNGGGSLTEAIELSGLFIPKGPVVQVRNADGSINAGDDPDEELFYDGPLGVVVNRFSASASEIFAGAMQDYQRGIVIGEQTFGKGTVQNLIDLDQIMSTDEKLGQLKLTLAKFYRVTGSSTQHKGVVPDIELPSEFSSDEFGESSSPSALPWDQIKSSKFRPMRTVSEELISTLQAQYQDRLRNDEELISLVQDIEDVKKLRAKTLISLNIEERKKEKQEMEEKRDKTGQLEGSTGDFELDDPEAEEEVKEEGPYIKESVRIMAGLLTAK